MSTCAALFSFASALIAARRDAAGPMGCVRHNRLIIRSRAGFAQTANRADQGWSGGLCPRCGGKSSRFSVSSILDCGGYAAFADPLRERQPRRSREISFTTCRKSGAFPHIDGQSPDHDCCAAQFTAKLLPYGP